MRKAFFWIHLTAGLTAGAVILVMSVSGAIITFEPQVLRFVERGQRTVASPDPPTERLGPEALVSAALELRPGTRPVSVTFDADPRAAATLGAGREGVLHMNPYTGQVLGEGSPRWRGFFRTVTEWHRFLGVSGEGRDAARAVTGAANAAFLFLALSGLYLWWPRQWSARFLRPIAFFQGGLRGKARDFNWHNVAGLWSAPVLAVLTLTALPISYPAIGNWLYAAQPAAGAAAPRGAPRGETRAGREAPVAVSGLDRAWERARAQAPSWTLMVFRIPARPEAPVTVAISESPSRSPFGRSQMSVDPRTGALLKWEPFSGFAPGRSLRVAARWAHTGEILGWPGQLVAALASLGGTLLVWTGVALAWRRFRAWRAAPARRAPAASDPRTPAAEAAP